ncbi:MerR family DNA-binding transcriptional regulator [Patescibacteria group bacterium]|nr:MerR family DNA-binding transcriptional regulator [Patescibacteria group bacterium]
MKRLSIGEAARTLNVSPLTLRRWDKAGKLVPSRTKGNQRRYCLNCLRKAFLIKKGKAVDS